MRKVFARILNVSGFSRQHSAPRRPRQVSLSRLPPMELSRVKFSLYLSFGSLLSSRLLLSKIFLFFLILVMLNCSEIYLLTTEKTRFDHDSVLAINTGNIVDTLSITDLSSLRNSTRVNTVVLPNEVGLHMCGMTVQDMGFLYVVRMTYVALSIFANFG
jgi:hypothetical protein